jgi:hypothetical protein
MTDALDPLIRVAKRLQAEAAEIGLTQVNFTVLPSLEGGDHYVQVAFCLKEDPPPADRTFDEITQGLEADIEEQQRAEDAAKAERDRARLREFFEGLRDPSGGLGLDDKGDEQ